MYLTFPRRRSTRRTPVAAHEGSRRAFLDRHEAEARTASGFGGADRDNYLNGLFDLVADDRNLLLAFEHIVREGGPARGVDGIGPRDIDFRDGIRLVRELRRALLAGEYRPGPVRNVDIPKASGGTRTLSVLTVADRVVERGIVQVVHATRSRSHPAPQPPRKLVGCKARPPEPRKARTRTTGITGRPCRRRRCRTKRC